MRSESVDGNELSLSSLSPPSLCKSASEINMDESIKIYIKQKIKMDYTTASERIKPMMLE